jgi:methylglutaconyl-CoA hydratase
MFTTIQFTVEDRIATLTLRRPEKRNAISQRMMDELRAALTEAERAPARILVLAAEGTSFCAGLDLSELRQMASHGAEKNRQHAEDFAGLLWALYQFPRPIIAAVQGPAVAGGAGLVMACDFAIAAEEACFGFPEVKVGLVPAIISAFLVRQVGARHARDLLLTGRMAAALEANRMGLVNEVVASSKLMPRVQQLAGQLLGNSPMAMQAAKALLRSYEAESLNDDLARGMKVNATMRQSADYAEGVRSFLERRKPRWEEGTE